MYDLTSRRRGRPHSATEHGIEFIPWSPIDNGTLAQPGGPVDEIAKAVDATQSQIAVTWLLARSPVVLRVPGTLSVGHVEDNIAAAQVQLSMAQVVELTNAAWLWRGSRTS